MKVKRKGEYIDENEASVQLKRTALRDFSLNWIILLSQPIGVAELNNHINSTWARTWDCTNTEACMRQFKSYAIKGRMGVQILMIVPLIQRTLQSKEERKTTLEVSTPHAKYIAAVSLVALASCCVSYGSVICKWQCPTNVLKASLNKH